MSAYKRVISRFSNMDNMADVSWKKIVYTIARDNPGIVANVIDEILGDTVCNERDIVEREVLKVLGSSPTSYKINAIKKYRELTNASLLDANFAVEEIMQMNFIIVG